MYKHTKDFINDLGGYRAVAQRLGLKPTTMHSHLSTGVIPAKWYAALCELAREKKVMPPPSDLFDFKPLIELQNDEAAA